MSTLAASLLTAVVTAVLAVVGTYLTTRRNLEATFDSSLRDLRLEAYKALWKELELLAKYDRPEPLTRDAARGLAATLGTWYFGTGGLFLSNRTRQDYFALQDGIETVTAGDKKRLRVEDDEFLRVLASRLRTGMTADVGTRRTFPFRATGGGAESEKRTYGGKANRPHLVVTRGRPRFLLFGRRELSLTVEGVAGSPRWDPVRRAFSARVTENGSVEERVFLLEGTEVVEGPEGWQRGAAGRRRGSAVWRESKPKT